jgi:excisionase family DNA binding protein
MESIATTKEPNGASPLLADFIDKSSLARELRCTTRTVDRLALVEGLPFTQVGGKRLFRRSAVLSWLAARETPAHPQTNGKQRRGVR